LALYALFFVVDKHTTGLKHQNTGQ